MGFLSLLRCLVVRLNEGSGVNINSFCCFCIKKSKWQILRLADFRKTEIRGFKDGTLKFGGHFYGFCQFFSEINEIISLIGTLDGS